MAARSRTALKARSVLRMVSTPRCSFVRLAQTAAIGLICVCSGPQAFPQCNSTFQQYCGKGTTSPCDYTNCLSGSGTCSYMGGNDPCTNSRNVQLQQWYACFKFSAAFYQCSFGYVACGTTYDYIDTCTNACFGSFYWTGCAALSGSTPCPGS